MKNVLAAGLSLSILLISSGVNAEAAFGDPDPLWRSDWQQSTKAWMDTRTRDLDLRDRDDASVQEANPGQEEADRARLAASELEHQAHREELLREVRKFAEELAGDEQMTIEALHAEMKAQRAAESGQSEPGASAAGVVSED